MQKLDIALFNEQKLEAVNFIIGGVGGDCECYTKIETPTGPVEHDCETSFICDDIVTK